MMENPHDKPYLCLLSPHAPTCRPTREQFTIVRSNVEHVLHMIVSFTERIYELFPRLGERRKQEGTTLSGGEQQMLAIGRALARDIKLLLLDEPYEGLAPVIVQEIEKTLRLIREQGITTIIVEQNAVAALKLADRAVILDTGGVVFSGTAKEVLENEKLRHEYLAI